MKKPLASFFSRNPREVIGSFAVGFAVVSAILGLACNTQAQSPPPITSGKVIKWDQPPVLATPTNVFYGWNEPSVYGGQQIAADDWVCTTTNPVMKIRWWGSFLGYNGSDPTPVLPPDFAIHFWNDVPKGPGNTLPFSHPANAIWQIITTNFTATCVGKDYDPRTQTFETCFLFEADLNTQDWFFQQPLNGTNIYWISIAADYPTGAASPNPFGWKTRPRDPNSAAPDAAIDILNPTAPVLGSLFMIGNPITFPTPNNEWDLAFELITAGPATTAGSKWEQLPDLTPTGIDVNDTFDPQLGTPRSLLASDFLCTNPGFITNIVIWGSWSNDIVPVNPTTGLADPGYVQFTLSFHADIPAVTNAAGTTPSRPGPILWTNIFNPGQFTQAVEAANITEGWMDPPANFIFPGDHTCYRYEFNLFPAVQAVFFQSGTAANPTVYWIDVQATIIGSQSFPRPVFGWKTSVTNWNDDSTWATAVDSSALPPTAWNPLVYPPTHPSGGKSIDLAFRLNTETSSGDLVKWSQPPVVATNVGNWYNGWNEPSIDGGGIFANTLYTNIVADDWICTNGRPVTDIHWWGSFLNWSGTSQPPQPPVAYRLAIWTDFPTNVDTPFSHPGTVLWSTIAAGTDPNLRINWVGWDLDPRTSCLDVESCFKFDYFLAGTNNWFYQKPGTNIYWLSISAMYGASGASVGPNPFGWKTRPHFALDDAVDIYQPLTPTTGLNFGNGQPIEFPQGTSWDMAFRLTTCQPHPKSNVTFTNIIVTNIGVNQLITLNWNPEAGVVYQVQEATNLPGLVVPSGVWSDVGPVFIGPSNSLVLTNPISISPPNRFYRILVPDICPP